MSLESLKSALPEYAKDLKLNLSSLAAETVLSEQQRAGTFIASAIASRHPATIAAVAAEFGPALSAQAPAPARDAAFEPLARRGAELFFGDAGCSRCHSGPLLSDDDFHNIGVPPFGPGKVGGIDEGRFLVTGEPSDRFAFRTPPLRNVALTPPYMHDGVFATLREAVEHHLDPEANLARREVRVGDVRVPLDPALAEDIRSTLSSDVRPLRPISPDDLDALLFFLGSLSSNTEQFGLPPAAGEPPEVPSGLPPQGSNLEPPPRF